MIEDDFFQPLKGESEYDYLINLITARGFLLEEYDQKLHLSDNGHKEDAAYLDKLLQQYDLGYVKEDQIYITPGCSANKFEAVFSEKTRVAREVCIDHGDWQYFRQRKHGHKVPVKDLEPFIARYVKAISACGVLTVGSCDGNHPGSNSLFLQLPGLPTQIWHELIYKEFLKDRYSLTWDQHYTEITFTEDSKYKIYSELNRVAEELYNSRLLLRQIRNSALSDMTNSFLKHRDPQTIEKIFTEKVKEGFAMLSH